MILKYLPIFLQLLSICQAIDLEKLESLGINQDFYVSDVAVFFNRAFLAIPRTVCQNNVTHPTLVEVPWKELNVILKSRINKPIEDQLWANCEDLQNAVSLAKEGAKSKLWILDRGNEYCAAKIIAYGMLQNAFIKEETIELAGEPKNGLTTIVVENGTKLGNHRAFIANAGDHTLLMCFLKDLACSRLKLMNKLNPLLSVRPDFLSISKTDTLMYLTGMIESEVFSFDIGNLPEEFNVTNTTHLTVNLSNCGQKLGPSSDLETDLKGGLTYYLTRDYAIVRWLTGKPMQAEHHDVLAQSYNQMPYVSRIFTDPQGSIFALVNPFSPVTCQKEATVAEATSNNFTEQKDQPLERVVKLLKYNRLLDKFY